MNEFENFLKENNYEGDLEFQLCDLELAFDSGKKLQWKPSDEQMKALHDVNLTGGISYAGQGQLLIDLYNYLKQLKQL